MDLSEALTVTLASNDASEATVPASVVIPADMASASFAVTAVDDNILDGTQTTLLTASHADYAVSGTQTIDVTDHETLTVVIAADSIAENAGIGATTATVSRSDVDTLTSLEVTLTNGDDTELVIPTTVTIPANSNSVTLQIDAVDDMLLDGTIAVSVSASAAGFLPGGDSVEVTDHETLTLSISAASIAENAGLAATTATVARSNTDIGSALVVTLANSDSSEIGIPATVTIPANAPSVSFEIDAEDDNLLDGTQTVTIAAAAVDYSGGDSSLDVTDHEPLTLEIDPDSISEDGGSATATLTRHYTNREMPLSVSLSSDDESELTVPPAVEIPANEASVSFTVNAVDDTVLDGTQTVIVTAVPVADLFGLDQSFGQGGLVQTSLAMRIQPPRAAIAVQPDGKIVAAAEHPSDDTQWRVTRVNADGTLDAGFGVGGIVDTTIGSARPFPTSIAVQPDGKILVGGKLATPGTPALVRYNADGSLDPTFGSGGLTDLGLSSRWVNDVALRPDGRILVALGLNGTVNLEVAQVDSDGSLDGAFGSGGVATLTGGAISEAITLLADGRFLVSGSFASKSIIARGNADGALDATYATNGVRAVDLGFQFQDVIGQALDSEGRLVIGLSVSENFGPADFGALRLNPDGSLDASFAGDGSVITDFPAGLRDYANTIVVTPSDMIILAGRSEVVANEFESAMIRYNADGSLDTSFDGDGFFHQSLIPDTRQRIIDVALTADERLAALPAWSTDYRVAMFHLGDSAHLIEGIQSTSANVDVTDHETLSVSIDRNSISEDGGVATATVTRGNTDRSQTLTVALASDDLTEATVPTTVEIPAGEASATFDITAVDDELLDGTQTVLITATHSGYAVGGADTVDVTDHETLELTIEAVSISEFGGSTTATVARSNTDDLSAPLIVALANGDASEASLPTAVVIPAHEVSASFVIDAVDDALLDGTQSVSITASHGDYVVSGSDTVAVTDHETLTLSIDASSISENGGAAAGTVTRSNIDDLSQPLTVELASDDASEAGVPDTVTIAANEASATFTIRAVDDALLDGVQTVLITATHADYAAGGNATVEVIDHEALELTVDAAAISENGGSATGTVSRSNTDDLSQPLTVSLSSNDTSEASVPSTVTIPANEESADFPITAVDDALLDGPQVVSITADHADYAIGGSDAVDVTDFEALELSIAPLSISENGGVATGTVSRSNTDDLSQALTVSLSSNDTSEASVPSTVTIPANEESADFPITAVDDALLDGIETATITASHTAYAVGGSDTVDVSDYETLELSIALASISEDGGVTSGTVTRSNTDDLSQPLTVSIASDDTSEASVPSTVTIPADEESATFTITAVDDALLDGPQVVSITAGHADYTISGASVVEVADHETLSLSIDPVSISELDGEATGTVSRSNTDDLSEELVVHLASDDASEATVPATVIIPANEASASFTIHAEDDALLDGTQSVLLTASQADYAASGNGTLDVTDDETLTLSIDPGSISEDVGSATGTVARSNIEDLSQPLTVTFSSSDTSEAEVPLAITIPVGQASQSFVIDAVDDNLLDGTQTVTVTATASGYADGLDTVEVTDFEMLTLSIDAASIPENGSSAIGTVSRSNIDDRSQPLVVDLASSDTTEAVVPTTIEIPANEISATFTIDTVDDAFLDGTQIVTITAAHADYAVDGDATLEVTDHETLELTIDAASISENGGSASGTVSRGNTDDLSQPLTVDLASDDTSEASVPATVEIPANQASATFTIDAVDDALLDGTQTVIITASHADYAVDGEATLAVTDHETIELTIDAASISEDGGSGSGTVSRSNIDDLSQPLTVSLASNDTTEAAVPVTVEIPANQASTTFTIDAVDDAILDGTQTVTITAAHADYAVDGEATLEVTDHETIELTIDVASISENGGSASGTVSRSNTDDLSQQLTVNLASDDTTEASLPVTVQILANQVSATFTIDAVDDALLDGTQTVTVTAAHADYAVDGEATLEVTDHETLEVTLDAASISENGSSASGTVSRSNTDDLSQPLTVDLASDDTSEASVPATVEIPANQTSATFTIDAVDDALLDGTQTVIITASQADYAVDGEATLEVSDHETLELTIDAASISEDGGSASGTVSRSNIDDLSQPLTVSLASNDTTEAAVPVTVEIPANQASTTFTIDAVDDALLDGTQTATITASHADYAVDGEATLEVTDFETLELTIDPASISENGGSASGTVSRSNIDDLSQPLTVSLASNDTTEAAVPVTVEIPANQASTTFAIDAVDDALLDGTQTVTITASHAGYAVAGDATLEVTDHETLTLTIDAAAISERVGSTTATVTRSNTDDLSQTLTVNLASSDLSEASVPASIEIPANAASISFTIDAVDDELLDGTQQVELAASAFGYVSDVAELDVTDHETLAVSIEESSISEAGGVASGTVTRSNTDTSQPLTVLLSSDDMTEASVPGSVTIPAGANSAGFLITGVDDASFDGLQTVAIAAAADGYESESDSLSIEDHETLTVTIDAASFSEAGGSATVTVTRSNTDDVLDDLSIRVWNDDSSEASVPGAATIPAGAASVMFPIVGVDDVFLDGPQTVTIRSTANGYITQSTTLVVEDHETLTIAIEDDSLSEAGGATIATVTRSNLGDLGSPLVVVLASDDVSEATVPQTVIVPANQASATFAISAVDDDLLDGTQQVAVTAAADGYLTGSETIEITDLETLTLTIDAASISEFGGTATATITRNNTDLAEPVIITLASDDPSEASVPATVIIPPNDASATFTVTGADDALLDGTQTATITANSAAYVSSQADLDVTDYELLELSVVSGSISENGGVTTGILSRFNTDDLSQPLTVSLTNLDPSEIVIPAEVTIPANVDLVAFEIHAADDALLDGTQDAFFEASHPDYATTVNALVPVSDHEALSLSIDELSISENGGSATGTVSRSNIDDLSQPLVVDLSSDDTSEADVPVTVTIPAGQASAPFAIHAVDDSLLDGTETVAITATHADYAVGGDAMLDVTDHETLALSVDAASISENGGSATGTVSRSNTDDLSQPLTVNLSSNETSEATVPATVEIPANQVSATFAVTAVDDSLLDGTQSVTITATHAGYSAGGGDSLDVTDHELLELLIAAGSISENGTTVTGTVVRSNSEDLSQPLVVELSSDDTSEAAVPTTVEIPANQASATFTIDAVDDSLLDGTQSATITAMHADYAVGGVATLQVTDFETLALSIAPASISEQGGSAIGTVSRSNTDDLSQPLTVSLSSDDTSEAAVPATVEIPANAISATFTIDAVDDALLDAARTVTVTAAHTDYAVDGEATLEVTDHETLALSIDPASISEEGGSAIGTVSRSSTDDLSQPLTASLSSGDTSEAILPTTVEIPAHAVSAAFIIEAVDDLLLDGQQNVTITASAGGYVDATGSLEVTDHETLAVSIPTIPISENGGSAIGTVTRSNTDDLSQPLTVSLFSSDTSEADVPASITIPANQASQAFTIDAVDDDLLDGFQTVTITATAGGYGDGSDTVDVADFETLQLSIDPASISEDGGSATGTVSRSNTDDLSQPLTVNLASDDTSEATVAATVQIPANQTSATFVIDAVDDALLDGTQTVTITASHADYPVSGEATLDVTDVETLELSIDVASISENGGSATGTVTRGNTDDLSQPLTVNLASDDTSEATVPATVEIPANQTSATFVIDAVDDALLDGTLAVTLTAAHADYAVGGEATLEVTDFETLSLSIDAASMLENGGAATGTVSRSNTDDLSQPLTVHLFSDDTSEASVPAIVEIAANQASATFTVDAVDDALLDGTQTVTVTASHADYVVGGESTLQVTDFETLALSIEAASISENGGAATGTVSRSNTDDLSQPLTVNLASDDASEATAPVTVEIPANQASATFPIDAVDDALLDGGQTATITASHANYAADGSDTLEVTDHETLALSIDAVSISENDGSATGTVSRSNADDLSQPLTVHLVSDDTSEASVAATVEIPANQASMAFTIDAVDDALLDGTQTVTVTATHADYAINSSDTLEVTDHETLALSIDSASISENSGSATGTVTRSNTDDLSQPLTVQLSRSDTTEATVPPTVEIAANQTSASFTIDTIDDVILDGTQTVTVTASHADYAIYGEATVDVTDHETLEISLDVASISEDGGSATGTVTRSNIGNLSSALIVDLASDDTSEATVPATVEIPANQTSATFAITAVDDALLDGAQTVTITATHAEYATGFGAVMEVTDHETLALSIDAASISEDGGSTTATVSRSNTDDLSEPLVVDLASDDISEAIVSATVQIPANEVSATFTIDAVDDALLDGTQTVTITAAHAGYSIGGSGTLSVLDHETLELSIDLASISEAGGSATGTVSRRSTDDLSQPLAVDLVSDDASEATVPASVEIPAGQASTTFAIDGVDDSLLDGTQTVLITATHAGYAVSGSSSLDVTDHEPLSLSLEAASVMEHNGGISATVSRHSADTDDPLVVSIASSPSDQLILPENVTIPAGESSVDFTISAASDGVPDGTQTVEIIASATGYADIMASLEVTDNPFPWHFAPLPRDVNTDGSESPIDALIIINEVNAGGSRQLPSDVVTVEHFYDVNADGFLSPLDALIVINFLNGDSSVGEGEAGAKAELVAAGVTGYAPVSVVRADATTSGIAIRRQDVASSALAAWPSHALPGHTQPSVVRENENAGREEVFRKFAAEELEEVLDLIAEDILFGDGEHTA